MRMLRHNRLFQAAVAAGIVALGASDALAWGHHKGSYGSSSSASYGGYSSSGSSGSYGSYGSSSSSSYGSYYASSSSSSGSYGSSSGGRPGMFARWHARKAAKHSSGSSASYGTYAYSSSGSSASYGSYSGSSGSSASYGGYAAPSGYYDNGIPVEGDSYVPADGGVPTEPQPAAPLDTPASIRVNVPADALVFVNDRPTTSTGAERSFVSRGLANGRTYAYQLRVEYSIDGKQVVENKTVRLHAGESIDLSFGAGEQVASEGAASTDLTLHVPAGAKVTLAGAVTRQTGETRTYATSSLAPGQEWNGYVVRVELEQNGQTLVEEKTLSLTGGQAYELSFDFAGSEAQVASLN